jgi:hypothetical protein
MAFGQTEIMHDFKESRCFAEYVLIVEISAGLINLQSFTCINSHKITFILP